MEGESFLRLEVELDGCVGKVEEDRLVLPPASPGVKSNSVSSTPSSMSKYSIFLSPLTSTIRYVVVLQGYLIDSESISTSLH